MKRVVQSLVAIFLLALAPVAVAANPNLVNGSDYLVNPGETITFSGMTINSCNADVAGVNLQQDTVQGDLARQQHWCECEPVSLDPVSFTNETSTDQTFRLWLQDNSCSFIYFADGGHAKVGPKQAALNDSGEGCSQQGGGPDAEAASRRRSACKVVDRIALAWADRPRAAPRNDRARPGVVR